MQPTKADNQIEEEHLLNFVANSLNEELPIDLADGVRVSSETLYEVLAGASASGTSVNQICEETEDSPHANTVRGYLTDQFDLDTVEQVGDTLLQQDTIETLPDRPVEVVADLHLDPYYGDDRLCIGAHSEELLRQATLQMLSDVSSRVRPLLSL